MKAFLLAGGYGTRLGARTARRPKCLVPIHGRPLLARWLDHCARSGITDVLLNVSHHGSAVRRFLHRYASPVRVTLVEEPVALGNAGTVLANRAFVAAVPSFFILYADNLTTADLGDLWAFHGTHDGVLTLGLFQAPRPRETGNVAIDDTGRVTAFVEKPVEPVSPWANAGIYVARPSLFAAIPCRSGVVDFAYDVIPPLVGRMYGRHVSGYLVDAGTEAGLATARAAARRIDAGDRAP